MKAYCLYLYRHLMRDLALIKESGVSKTEMTEKCFYLCVDYWARLVKRVKHRGFCNSTAEVIFYKELKPLFTSEAEYHSMLYHVALFKPIDEAFLKPFWLRELDRIDSIIKKVPTFYAYYRSGETSQDSYYFTSSNCSLESFMVEWSGNKKEAPFDLLVSQYMALDKYKVFVNQQLCLLREKC